MHIWREKQIRSSLMSVGCKALLTLVSLPVWGAPLPCAQTTLENYISLAEGCTVDSLLFSNFGFTENTATSNPSVDDIIVSPSPSTGPDDWTGIGITHVSGQFLLLGPQLNIDFEITFTVSGTLYPLYGVSLFSDASATGSGNHARVREFVDYGSGTVQMHSNHSSNGPHTREFPSAQSVDVTKLFVLDTGNGGGSSAISFVDQGFYTHAPEPTTIILGGCGLLAIVFCGRRSRFGKSIPSKTA